VVKMMTMYLSVCQQQRLPLEYSHTRIAALFVSDTSVCCATYVRLITVSDIFLALYLSNSVGRDSVDGTATGYGLGSPRIETRCGRDFSYPSRPALGPTQTPVQWVRVPFPGVKAGGAWG
jgi:hypothetical protein